MDCEQGGPGCPRSQQDDDRVVLSIRLIRSFAHRNVRTLVVALDQRDERQHLDLITAAGLANIVRQRLQASALPPPFKKYDGFDCMKIEHQAHGSKTSDPLINVYDDDTLILKPEETLASSGVKHETVITYFNTHDYEQYKKNPEQIWE